ncbi:SH3 domain-containing protein [Streptomyces sp. NPDC004111]|uniref:SH3 domain-containing protein n=1 Tax=Streptomyces sp. NPDC004111 TaxID=3364690 RepID=UPI0036A0A3BC
MLTPKKTALWIAAGALTATLAATPALAGTAGASDAASGSDGAATAQHPRHTEGRVTAKSGLRLRDKPTRSSRIIRTEPYGATVHIFCKTTGDHVEGNDHWYLLTDGTWAWGSAQYIVPLGQNPRWC